MCVSRRACRSCSRFLLTRLFCWPNPNFSLRSSRAHALECEASYKADRVAQSCPCFHYPRSSCPSGYASAAGGQTIFSTDNLNVLRRSGNGSWQGASMDSTRWRAMKLRKQLTVSRLKRARDLGVAVRGSERDRMTARELGSGRGNLRPVAER